MLCKRLLSPTINQKVSQKTNKTKLDSQIILKVCLFFRGVVHVKSKYSHEQNYEKHNWLAEKKEQDSFYEIKIYIQGTGKIKIDALVKNQAVFDFKECFEKHVHDNNHGENYAY
jgi:hypothetical protein